MTIDLEKIRCVQMVVTSADPILGDSEMELEYSGENRLRCLRRRCELTSPLATRDATIDVAIIKHN